ncbi:DUF362 domain-containing protein [Kineosporia sp. J2-2]|uniref:DUF362 domain-containing protein n=1 Tax=Kineosporia corallincola TaxID=2835133 RepID=A0ABS5TR96_9ACTN|nr:DUF362 domain-containing protein [Kineosporia corallincola]MBT0772989.1 DUF362 domain-containing protein [Kineosporia corallincola]
MADGDGRLRPDPVTGNYLKNVHDNFAQLMASSPDAQAVRTVGLDYDGPLDSLQRVLDGSWTAHSDVTIAACPQYSGQDCATAIQQCLDTLHPTKTLHPGSRVLIKVGLVEARHPDEHVTVHPVVVRELLRHLITVTGSPEHVLVADGSGHERDTDQILRNTGLGQVLHDLGVRFIDLNLTDLQAVPVQDSLSMPGFILPSILFDCDLVISLAKLKTHHRSAVTLGMKNLFGCAPGAVYGFPKTRLHYGGTGRVIADLASVVRPGLTIIDAVTGMEGMGPLDGTPRPFGALIAGENVATTDYVATQLMGFSPGLIPQFWYAEQKGLLTAAHHQGLPPQDLTSTFQAPSNISWLHATQSRSPQERRQLLETLLEFARSTLATTNA